MLQWFLVVLFLADIGFDATSSDVPTAGLVAEKATFAGAEVEDFRFSNGRKYIYVETREEFSATFSYHLRSPCSETLHFHYFLVGFYEPEDTVCEGSNPAVCDACGEVRIRFRAPEVSGTYQVRFCETKQWTVEEARSSVWEARDASGLSVMGVVIVKSRVGD